MGGGTKTIVNYKILKKQVDILLIDNSKYLCRNLDETIPYTYCWSP